MIRWRPIVVAGGLVLALLIAARAEQLRPAVEGFDMQAAYADPSAMIPRMRAHLERTPRDGRGWVILARLEFAEGRFVEAAGAYERALAASRKVAQDPQVWCELADALGMAQGGRLKGRPRELIDRALGLKGTHPRALEMAGSAEVEARNYPGALLYWEPLLAQLDSQSPEYRELQRAIRRLKLQS